MPQFKLKDLFVLTAIIAAGLGALRFAFGLADRQGDLILQLWMLCAGAFLLFVAPAMYWGSICRRGKIPSVRDKVRRLNFWSGVLLMVTIFAGVSFLADSEVCAVSPARRIAFAIAAIVAAITGGTLGTIAKRLKKREYWEGAPPHSWTPRSDIAHEGKSEIGKR